MYMQHYSNKEDIGVPRDTLMMLGSASHCLLVISINLPKMSDVVQSIYYNIRCSLVVSASTLARKSYDIKTLYKDLQQLFAFYSIQSPCIYFQNPVCPNSGEELRKGTFFILQCRSFESEFNRENITHKHLNNDNNNGIFGMQMCVVVDSKCGICRT